MTSEIRKNPFSGQHVLVENDEIRLEDFFSDEPIKKGSAPCVFCEGKEKETPPEIVAFRPGKAPANTPGWLVRTVPNRFPVLQIEGELNLRPISIYDQMQGVGADEIIIVTPCHEKTFDQLIKEELKSVLWMTRDRVEDLKKDHRFRSILIFDHEGSNQDHPHLHVYAFPMVIQRLEQELNWAEQYYQLKERCLYCDAIYEEQRVGQRLIFENEHFISFQPFPARQTFETWILPRKHSSDFEKLVDSELEDLAQVFADFWSRLRKIIGVNISCRLALHTGPNREYLSLPDKSRWPNISASFHWHFELRPWTKLEKTRFENATGVYQNPVPPEISSSWLRQALEEKDKL